MQVTVDSSPVFLEKFLINVMGNPRINGCFTSPSTQFLKCLNAQMFLKLLLDKADEPIGCILNLFFYNFQLF